MHQYAFKYILDWIGEEIEKMSNFCKNISPEGDIVFKFGHIFLNRHHLLKETSSILSLEYCETQWHPMFVKVTGERSNCGIHSLE